MRRVAEMESILELPEVTDPRNHQTYNRKDDGDRSRSPSPSDSDEEEEEQDEEHKDGRMSLFLILKIRIFLSVDLKSFSKRINT